VSRRALSAPVSESCDSSAAPLAYTVRHSNRARRVTLRVMPGVGLVVSVPKRFARRDIPGVVEQHRAWAESALAELEATTPEVCRTWPPETLELAALERRVAIRWTVGAVGESGPGSMSAPVVGRSAPGACWPDTSTLELDARPDDRVGVAKLVAEALRLEGRRTLVPRLEELAARHGFRYARVSVRGQRSVWGSYSSSGTLSLNWKLLFLPPELVDYVLLHELAHTRHLDHSAAFWRLLDAHVPEAKALDRALVGATRLVPPWLELARGT